MRISKKIKIFLIISILMLGLSACSGDIMSANSWPGVTSNPDDDVIYIAFGSTVRALNASTGTARWIYPSSPDDKISFYAQPGLTPDSEQLLLTGYDQKIYSINPESGQGVNWSFAEPKDKFIGGAVSNDRGIFAPSSDGYLHGLNHNGTALWPPFQTQGDIWSTPVLDDKFVYIISMEHILYAVDQATGQEAWQVNLGSAVVSTPLLSEDGLLFITTFGKSLKVVDTNRRAISCSFDTESWLWSGAALADDTLYFGDTSGSLYAVGTNCTPRWAEPFKADGEIYGTPVVIDETVYFSTESGNVYAVRTNGVQRWSKALSVQLFAEPVVVDNLVIFSGIVDNSRLFVSGMDLDGTIQWNYETEK